MNTESRFCLSYFIATYALCFLAILAVSFAVPVWMIPLGIIGCAAGLWFSWFAEAPRVGNVQIGASVGLVVYAASLLRQSMPREPLLILLLQLLLMLMVASCCCAEKKRHLQSVNVSALMLVIGSVCLPGIVHPALQAGLLVATLLIMLFLLQITCEAVGSNREVVVCVRNISVARVVMTSLAAACLISALGWLIFQVTPKRAISFNLPGQGTSATDFKVVTLKGLPVTFGPLTVATGEDQEFLQQEYRNILLEQKAHDIQEQRGRKHMLPFIVAPQQEEEQPRRPASSVPAADSVLWQEQPQPLTQSTAAELELQSQFLAAQIAQERHRVELLQAKSQEGGVYATEALMVQRRLYLHEQQLEKITEHLQEEAAQQHPVEQIIPQETRLTNATDIPGSVVALGSSVTPVQGHESAAVLHRVLAQQHAPESGDSVWQGQTAIPANVQKEAMPVPLPPQVQPQGTLEEVPSTQREETVEFLSRGIGATSGGGMNGRLTQKNGEGTTGEDSSEAGEPISGLPGVAQAGEGTLIPAEHTQRESPYPGQPQQHAGALGISARSIVVVADAAGEPLIPTTQAGLPMPGAAGTLRVEYDTGEIAALGPGAGTKEAEQAAVSGEPAANYHGAAAPGVSRDRLPVVRLGPGTARTQKTDEAAGASEMVFIQQERDAASRNATLRDDSVLNDNGKISMKKSAQQDDGSSPGQHRGNAVQTAATSQQGAIAGNDRGNSQGRTEGETVGEFGGGSSNAKTTVPGRAGQQAPKQGVETTGVRKPGPPGTFSGLWSRYTQPVSIGQGMSSLDYEKIFPETRGRVILYVVLAISICGLAALFFIKLVRNACLWYMLRTDPNRAIKALYYNALQLFEHSGIPRYDWMSCEDLAKAARKAYVWSIQPFGTLTALFARARYGQGRASPDQLKISLQVYHDLGRKIVTRAPWVRRPLVYVSMF